MAKKKINRDDIFTIPSSKFCIGASSSGYTFNYSVDGITWTEWEEATPANDNQIVVGVPLNLYFKLDGNTQDNVTISY